MYLTLSLSASTRSLTLMYVLKTHRKKIMLYSMQCVFDKITFVFVFYVLFTFWPCRWTARWSATPGLSVWTAGGRGWHRASRPPRSPGTGSDALSYSRHLPQTLWLWPCSSCGGGGKEGQDEGEKDGKGYDRVWCPLGMHIPDYGVVGVYLLAAIGLSQLARVANHCASTASGREGPEVFCGRGNDPEHLW